MPPIERAAALSKLLRKDVPRMQMLRSVIIEINVYQSTLYGGYVKRAEILADYSNMIHAKVDQGHFDRFRSRRAIKSQ